MSDPKQLNELHVNLLGKIFLTACAAWLVGKATNIKVRGNIDEVRVVSDVMMATKNFQEELNHPAATVESVMEKLNAKHSSAITFEKVIGMHWPL
jgi:hypothetical protein